MINDTVNNNGIDQPILVSQILQLLIRITTTSTESYLGVKAVEKLHDFFYVLYLFRT